MGKPRICHTFFFTTLLSLSLLGPVTAWGSCPDLLTAHTVSSKVYDRIDRAIDHAAQLEARPMTIDEGEALIEEGGGVVRDQINLDRPLTVYDSHRRPFTVSFTPELIKDFSSRRVSALVRSRLWHAIHNGLLADGQGRAGIKVMRTSEGIPFIEVKLLKGVAGSFRMFGCIKGDQIIMHFIGYDMTSVNDPQRVRLKRLCQ